MCGINGILRFDPQAAPPDAEEALRTRDSMTVRGPDGAGLWADPSGHIVLGHRRLSIIDLSEAGLQPMASADGRYRIVFNGEIYNYKELRSELAPDYPFRSHSDTEVILALFSAQGVPGLSRLRGMYAFGIWDDREKRLLLARDPNGIKPLYYSTDGKHLRFASQVKALLAGGAVATREAPAGVCGFLLWGSVPEPWTVYESVKSLPAGHALWVDTDGMGRPESLPPATDAGACDLVQAIDESVGAHLVSDVPVAVFLSSGIDSSLIASLAARRQPAPLVTITLRFREFAGTPDDEGPLAAEVARALGARHVERWVSRDEFLAAWLDTVRAMDQPSIDGLNTYWVCKAAQEAGIKVALSGLGGDELLGGYPSFRDVPAWQRKVRMARRLPGLATAWPRLSRWARPATPKLQGLMRYGGTLPGAYFLRRCLFLPEELAGLVGEELAVAGMAAHDPVLAGVSALGTHAASAWEAVHTLETRLYLRNQLLRDSDWASMAHSVELRVPLVDARLQRTAAASGFSLPRQAGKRAVAAHLAPDLPRQLFRRRKTGFRTPAASWLWGGDTPGASRGSRLLAMRVLEAFGLRHEEA